MSTFPDKLRQAIAKNGIKQVDITRATGITSSVLSRYLSGKNHPTTDNIFAIGKYLGVSAEWLLSVSDAPESIQVRKDMLADKDKIIEVQGELIKNLQKQIREWEEWKASSKERHAKGRIITEETVRASTDHDKIRKKGKFESRDKRWEETMREDSKTKHPKKNPNKEPTLKRMLKKRRG